MSLLAMQRDFRAWLSESSDDAALRIGEAVRPGLEVYHDNYRAALANCLAEVFERVHLWIGDERFRSTTAAHIDVTPPHAWTLDAYAGDFPETLELLFGDDPEIAELGWLDLALSEAFVGPDSAPVDPGRLGGIDWDRAVLRLSPTLTTHVFRSNAAAIWSALSAGEVPPVAALLAEPVTMLVWRKGLMPCFRTLEPAEAKAIDLARSGVGFGSICAAMLEQLGEEDGVAAAGQLLGRWMGDGLVVGID
ncbi:DNA-binding domain-containing protein [Rhizorhabdus histidinilytica]|uniref:DNA-binding domain-containing protein n=1 Tax=Rhizorhabdus histidinilytica TaxID=439228 RepID=UPI00322009C1